MAKFVVLSGRWHSQQACSEASTVESNTLIDILQY
jgi:hypothetical protein